MIYSCFVVTIVYVRYMSVVYYLVLYSTVLLNNTSMNAPRLHRFLVGGLEHFRCARQHACAF